MKRRVEDTAKVEGVLAPHTLHNQRSPHTVSSLVQTSYPSQGVKGGGNPEVGGLAQYTLQPNYTMPSITTSLKSQSGGHTGILVQSHIRHNKVGGGATSPAVGPGVPTGGGGTGPGSGSTPGAAGAPQFQRLKVEDALSYLDQVKYKFNNQPQVYNDFLEIMKEFKSQCIDTPGVIARVSHLFKGYPELISGFNTFLPPGYKIEVQANDTGYSLQVSVSNPLGHHTMTEIPPLTPTQPQSVVVTNQQNKPPSTVYSGVGGNTLMSSGSVHVKGNDRGNTGSGNTTTSSGLGSTLSGSSTNLSISQGTPSANATPVHSSSQGNHQVPPPAPVGPPGVTSSNSGPPPGSGPASQPVEFNHAINYVNKIKNRFQGQPDKYKKFLEILHTYQKEQRNVKEGGGGGGGGKHLTEAEVYSQVAQLFENHDDLLAEFGQFLPDATSHNSLSLANLGSKMNDRKGSALSMKYPSGRGNDSNRIGGSNSGDLRGNDSLTKKGSPPGSSGGGKCSGGSGGGGGGGAGAKRSASELYSAAAAAAVAAAAAGGATVVSSSSSGHSPVSSGSAPSSGHRRRHHHHHHHHSSSSSNLPTPIKRQKLQPSSILATPSYFESIKRQLRNPQAYENLLRCCHLFNLEIISRCELLCLITPLLSRCPDVLAWFKEMLGRGDSGLISGGGNTIGGTTTTTTTTTGGGGGGGGNNSTSPPPSSHHSQTSCTPLHPIGGTPPSPHDHQLQPSRPLPHDTRPDLLPTTSTADIDFSTCKRIGASYCALPKHIPPPRCSGRNFLCKQVLNDTWVSFPTWSEDSTFVTSRKTQYEEYIYRCEDERFELDLVIESNAATIRVLEGVQKKMSRMTAEEMIKYKLDDTLGGSSPTIHIRAIKRIYGEKALDIIEGLKKHPSIAVPLVLKRLKGKEIEWRQAQKGFNKTWREQNEKFYLKSLDHQGINFKQNDLKALRSKSLYNEIEMAYDERNESEESKNGPHMVLTYCDRSVLDDAANLLIHHVKRQTAHKQDKTRIKQLLRQFLPDLFHHPRQDLSDDERDSNDEKIEVDGGSVNKENNGPTGINSNLPNNNKSNDYSSSATRTHISTPSNDTPLTNSIGNIQIKQENENDRLSPSNLQCQDEEYTLFYGNNSWYLFLRLHQILCERLAKMLERSIKIAEEEAANSVNRKESTAVALRLKPNEHCQDCYGAMLDMVKSVLDCSMDPTTFEDTLRNMFGIHAYVGFTLDRIVTYAVRQLQQLVSEESCVECYRLHTKYKLKGGCGGSCTSATSRQATETAYHRASTAALAGDNCYKIYFYKQECKVTVELLDSESEEEENSEKTNSAQNNTAQDTTAQSASAKWDEYIDSINANDKMNVDDRASWKRKAVYLHRNLKRWSKNKHTTNNSSNKLEDSNLDQCLFQATTDKILYVANNCVLYRKGAFTRAKQTHCRLSRRKYSRFERWHGSWAKGHVTRELSELCKLWLLGRGPATIGGDNSTTKHSTIVRTHSPNDTSPPYRQYSKYTVQMSSLH